MIAFAAGEWKSSCIHGYGVMPFLCLIRAQRRY